MTKIISVINGTINMMKESIVDIRVDAIVNAANNHLAQGGGVCGAIFQAAGSKKLKQACDKVGYCKVGDAVITPAFDHKNSKFIIHTVGPVWNGGKNGEAKMLYNSYMSSLNLAKKNGCKSIAFPLISSGSYGYPIRDAWEQALNASVDFLKENNREYFTIVFAILKDTTMDVGRLVLDQILNDKWVVMASESEKQPFEELDRKMQSFMKEILLLLKAMGMDPSTIYSMVPISERRKGVVLDAAVTNPDMARNYDTYQVENLQVPILILHSRDDRLASYEATVNALRRFPDCTFISFEEGGHLMVGHEDEVHEAKIL